MKRVLSLILIFVAVFAAASCSGKKKKDVIKEQVTKEISSEEGGTVSTSDESVSVEIPGDALDSNTQITVTIYESSHHATAEGEQIMSHIVEFEPSGTIFKKPIIITMRSTENIKNKVVSAAVYNEAKGEWSYSKHGAYAVIVGKDEAGDPIMQSAAGDPIMLNAAGDPIMMNAAGDPIMMAAAGDPIMLAAAGDPIMTNAAGDPIMNAAAGDPIMMTTGHFTAYAFITSKDEETADNDTDTGDDDDADNDADADEPVYVPECGNGIVDEGEECDGGADSHELRGPEAACRKDCTLVRCGDSILDEGEECDDGNTKDGDYCSADCKTVTGSCGDGTKQDNEECDDGNTADGDYCSPDCQTVTGSCGDGKKQSNEACDKADPEYGEGEGIGASCSDDCQIVTLSCGTLPSNAEWVSGDTYEATWNGEEYSSASAHYAEEGDCAYKCKATYSWIDSNCTCKSTEHVEDGVCKSNTLAAASCGTLPANAQWVSGDTYIPTWNGTAYSSAAANYAESGECAYKCKETYSRIDSNCTCKSTEHVEDGVCKSNTQAAASCGALPENAAWVDGDGTYIPTWNGEEYSSASANYAEEGDCAYKCKATYVWVETNGTCACPEEQHAEGGVCKSNTGEEQDCMNLPDNTAWKKSTYIPHWIDEAWSTEPAATYYADGGEECTFDCATDYHYEDASCQSDTKPAESCGTLPANAQWVGGDTYIPTWNGEEYTSASANYAEEGDCAYKCKETYTWIDSSCTCTDVQHVEDGICKSNTGEEQNCTNLPDNAAWKKSTYIPHWIDEAWSTEPAATYYADGGEECTFDCATDYHYEDGSCKFDKLAAASCGDLPENAVWVEGDGTYIPTWDGEEYSSATANYAEEGDCAFLCSGDYEWNESTMQCRAPLAKVLCTGQTKCFSPEGYVIDCPAEGEEFYGQDANYTARHSCTPQTYEKISEERNCIQDNDSCNIVDDLSTGLRWYLYSSGGTWENAERFCNEELDTGDGREWRLPTAKELMSIIDNGTSYPALRLAYFGNEFSSYNSYWSGTYYLNAKTGQDEVLVMDVGYGHLQYDAYGKEGSNYFACVSGEEYGVAGTFTEKNISGGTVVTDSATDLMWKAADDLNMTWDQAIAYCENLEYAGFYDWRLPNRNEFATILNYDKGFADNKSDFPGIIGGNYWTSTFAQTYGGSARAFIMEVGGGTMFGSGDTNGGGEGIRTAYTLCVRNDDIDDYQAVPTCDETGYTPCVNTDGMIWSQNINTDRYDPDYFMAARMCRESNNGGISQWRIPTIDEIRTILKSDVLGTGGECHVTDECNDISSEDCYDSEICETGFTMESIFYNDSYMVSSTTLSEDENHAWGVDFFDGSIVSYARNDDLYPMITVRCVKDEDIPERVTFPYTDDETSLVWSELSEYDLRWSEASEYCTEDEEYSWRLPTIEELETLVQGCHDGGCSPDVSGGYSALNDVSILWSSTITRNQMPTNVQTYYNVLDFMTASQVELTTDQIREYSAKVRCVAYPNACKSDPCLEIENSDGTCTSEDGVYICGCVEGYFWNGEECKLPLPLGNICTNQTSCYNFSSSMTCPAEGEDFFGQDAQYTNKCTAQSFTAGTGAQAGTVIDNNTGLVWEQSPSENEYTWDDAHNHCDDLNSANYGGKNNWRVPNPLEFMTIVDNSTYNPATNSNFTNMPSDSSAYFWTSAEFKGNTSYAYAFKPYYGSYYGFNSDSYLKTNTYKVLCVSGEEMQPATSADFTTQTISGKVVVTDSKTGLMWQKEYETDQTWQQALKYCEDSTYAGYSDWRLPNKNELTSLVNYEKSGVPYSYFPDMPSNNYFWSSSTYVDNTGTAWGSGSYSGGVGENGKRSDYNVRCVR